MLDDFYEEADADAEEEEEPVKTPFHLAQKKIIPPNLKFPVGGQKKTQQIDYDDILASMNLCVKNGKLHTINSVPEEPIQQQNVPILLEDSSANLINQARAKRQLYRRALWMQYLQREAQKKRIQEVKSKKLTFNNTNAHTQIGYGEGSNSDLNKIFNFMSR